MVGYVGMCAGCASSSGELSGAVTLAGLGLFVGVSECAENGNVSHGSIFGALWRDARATDPGDADAKRLGGDQFCN